MIGRDFTAVLGDNNMSHEMQKVAAETTADAAIRYNNYVDISKFIKTTFEREYGGSWQCVVGKNFAW